jgi:hypothetical protein
MFPWNQTSAPSLKVWLPLIQVAFVLNAGLSVLVSVCSWAFPKDCMPPMLPVVPMLTLGKKILAWQLIKEMDAQSKFWTGAPS